MNKSKNAIELIESIVFKKLRSVDQNFDNKYREIMKIISNKFFILSFNPIFLLILFISIFLTYSIDLSSFKLFVYCLFTAFYIINIPYFFRLVFLRYMIQKKIEVIRNIPLDIEDSNKIIESNLFFINLNYTITYGDLIDIKKQILLQKVKK